MVNDKISARWKINNRLVLSIARKIEAFTAAMLWLAVVKSKREPDFGSEFAGSLFTDIGSSFYEGKKEEEKGGGEEDDFYGSHTAATKNSSSCVIWD